jgi:hypothetical protein
MYDRPAAKRLILEILAAAGGRLRGKVRLHKAFYLAHLYYWRHRRGALTDYPVVRLPFGPGIEDAPSLILELEAEGGVSLGTRVTGPYTEAVFNLLVPIKVDKKTPRYAAIKQAVDYVKKRTAVQLSEETHVFSRSWQEAGNGDELNIYLDLLTDEEYERVKGSSREMAGVVDAVFSK